METKKEVKKRSPRKKKVEEVSESSSGQIGGNFTTPTSVEIDPTDDPVYEEIEGLEVKEGTDLEEIPDRGAPMPIEPSTKRKVPSMFPEDSLRNEGPSFWHKVIRRR